MTPELRRDIADGLTNALRITLTVAITLGVWADMALRALGRFTWRLLKVIGLVLVVVWATRQRSEANRMEYRTRPK